MRVLQDIYTGLATLPSTPPPLLFARIRLTDIATEWAEQQPLNPRALALEVAAVLRTLPGAQLLDLRVASAVLFDPASGTGGITHAALADYFDGVSQGTPPEQFPHRHGNCSGWRRATRSRMVKQNNY